MWEYTDIEVVLMEIEMETSHMTEEQWQAIIQNDLSYDSKFLYGVKTTGIFCRPSCKSRIPNKENVRIFQNADQALSKSYRPCKRCKPSGLQPPDTDWVMQIKEFIDTHFSEPLTLATLAGMCHGSQYHIQRTFKKIMGLSPNEYIQQVRMKRAMKLLVDTEKSIMKIGELIGVPNTAYFSTIFKRKTGYTPTDFRKRRRETYGSCK